MQARVIAEIKMDSGNPADSVTNTWYFDIEEPEIGTTDVALMNTAFDKLEVFYNAIDGFYPSIVQPTITLTGYDLSHPTPRTPVHTRDFLFTPTTTASLPQEVAVVLSFQAAPESGLPQARRRGRVFIGPLHINVLEHVTGVGPTLGAAFRTVLRDAALALRNSDGGVGPGEETQWAVYSPTTRAGGASLPDSMHDVDSGWVDNAFDIVRSRGTTPTVRTTFP